MPRFVLSLVVALALMQPAANASRPLHAPAAPRTPGNIRSDFNGDGYEDLAISVFTEDVGTVEDAGAVQIMYGTALGLSAAGNQFWTEDDIPTADGSEYQDMFGRSMAAGDLNRDGYTDLVIGIMHEDLENGIGGEAGALTVLYGSAAGLTATGSQWFTEDDLSSSDGAEAGDLFARSLDIADFNGDGYGDLAIGIAYEIVNGQPDCGAAGILYGSPTGLATPGNQFWSQDSDGIPDQCEPNERFGWSVSGGDYNGDGYDDLAIGDPGENPTGVSGAGSALVIYGTAGGLTATGSQMWSEDLISSTDGDEDGDWFGRNVRAGNFNGDAYEDLVASIPSEDVGNVRNAGSVTVLYGSAAGLTATGNQFWNQDSPDILDQAEVHDLFGRHTGVGDFNDDGYFDLAVGVVSEDVGTVTDAGAVNVIYGGPNGLDANAGPGNQFWTQDTPKIKGVGEPFDAMGRGVSGLDFNADGFDDLAIGVPGDYVAGLQAAGAINVLYGAPGGLRTVANQRWTQDSTGMLDSAEAGDLFGAGFPGQTSGGCGQGGTCTE